MEDNANESFSKYRDLYLKSLAISGAVLLTVVGVVGTVNFAKNVYKDAKDAKQKYEELTRGGMPPIMALKYRSIIQNADIPLAGASTLESRVSHSPSLSEDSEYLFKHDFYPERLEEMMDAGVDLSNVIYACRTEIPDFNWDEYQKWLDEGVSPKTTVTSLQAKLGLNYILQGLDQGARQEDVAELCSYLVDFEKTGELPVDYDLNKILEQYAGELGIPVEARVGFVYWKVPQPETWSTFHNAGLNGEFVNLYSLHPHWAKVGFEELLSLAEKGPVNIPL